MIKDKALCVVGLGYVGLPLAVEFGRNNFNVTGFDINEKRIDELKKGKDSSNEILSEKIISSKVKFTDDASDIKDADLIIIAVPTPIDAKKEPDLEPLKGASTIVGKNMKKGAIIVYESTVYPGVTEEVCVPVLERESKLSYGKDFKVGYSPERINPGDKVHTIDKIKKIVSGMDEETLIAVSELYSSIIKAGVYEASSIKVAEAAKVIENTQRDLNIALINELSLIFDRMDIPTREVLKAASTKWNFHNYIPGLVGGHCISVDPHYLLFKARELGYDPKVILAGRDVNDHMPEHAAELALRGIEKAGKQKKDSKILVLGLTFKENLDDTRNSKSKDVIVELKKQGFDDIYAYDPFVDKDGTENLFKARYIGLDETKVKFDVVMLLVSHDGFKKIDCNKIQEMCNEHPVLVDIKFFYDYKLAKDNGIIYYSF